MTFRRFLAWLSFAAIVLPAPVLAANKNPESDPSYQKAVVAYEKGEWNDAIALFSEALGHYPSLAAYANRGNAYSQLGDYDRAMADYNTALQLNNDEMFSRRVPLYYCRATLYYRKKEYAKAEADLDYVMTRINPPALLYLLRGKCRQQLGKAPDARRDFAAALKRSPDNIEAALAQLKLDRKTADAATTRGRLTRALAAVDKAPSAPACNAMAWFLATVDDPALRDGPRALAYATKAAELTAWKNTSYLDTLAAACAETGDFANAIKWEEQYVADPLVTESEREQARARLGLYRNSQPYRTAD